MMILLLVLVRCFSNFGVGEYVPPAPVTNAGFAAPGRVNPPADPARRTGGYNWGTGGRALGSS